MDGDENPLTGDGQVRDKNYPKPILKNMALVYLGLGSILMLTYIWGIWKLETSYPHGNSKNPDQKGAAMLWAGIGDDDNAWLLNIYYTGFVVATTGYFLNLEYMVYCFESLAWKESFYLLAAFATFMISEMFWLPMCVWYIGTPKDYIYYLIRFQLLISGSSGFAWAALVYYAVPIDCRACTQSRRLRGVAGALMFAGHCGILDMMVWPGYFYNDGRFPPVAPNSFMMIISNMTAH